MSRTCGSCRAPLGARDRLLNCALCLGMEHAELALAGGCELCEASPLSTLRVRLETFNPEARTTATRSPEYLPRASLSPSPPPLTDAQLPPTSLTAVASEGEDEEHATGDFCSLLASDSEEWSYLCRRHSANGSAPFSPELNADPTPALVGRVLAASGQAASDVLYLAALQIRQANLLRDVDEKGWNPAINAELRILEDLSRRATISAAQAVDRAMAALTVTERQRPTQPQPSRRHRDAC